MQTQTSNTLHNAIMEANSKDRPPMLAPGNYIQWKSRIKRYIDTKPNRELIHFCLTNPPYELGWKEKFVLDSEGNPITATQQVFETIDNDIYSTVDACPNACEMWKAIERLKQASTPMKSNKPLIKDEEAEDVDVYLYISMIGSLMYLTASMPDITFAISKGQSKLGLWYLKDSPFDLEAYSDSDNAGASLNRKSITGGCQFLGKRLISWQCKKQTIVANSTTEAEYVVAANCYRQVLWIQNQLLVYGFNLMNTNIYIDNESTICIMKNPVFHSKTKHIEIRHHFIQDAYEKKLIQVIKIHTDKNVVDLLTKAFDVKKDGRCFVDTSKVTTGNTFSIAGLTTVGQRDVEAHTWFEATSKMFNEPPLSRVNTLKSGEDSLKLQATATVKSVNDQEQIQALVDKKKVTITEDSIRSALCFDDAEGTACLPNEAIFDGLARMGAKTTAWNEFNSTMASAIIYNQVKGVVRHKEMYVISSHTKKIFANMRRIRAGFFGVVTPLFDTIMKKQKPRRKQRQEVEVSHDESEDEDHVPIPSSDPLPSGKDSYTLNELMVFYTSLQEQVFDLQEAKDAQLKEIVALKKKVSKLLKWRKSRSRGLMLETREVSVTINVG
nr:putative ribonuclease H-like domain-containing protein [Tanacetum cinerariifolium]